MWKRLASLALAGVLSSCSSSESTTPAKGVVTHDAGPGLGDAGTPTITGVTACGDPVDGGGVDYPECVLTMPVDGALSTTIEVPNVVVICGSGTNSTAIDDLSFGTALGGGTSVSVDVSFDTPIPFDQLGTFSASVQVGENMGDGGSESWKTAAGSCSVTISGSLCRSVQFGGADAGVKQERILSGSGTCTAPAMPNGGTASGALTIESFTFLETIGP